MEGVKVEGEKMEGENGKMSTETWCHTWSENDWKLRRPQPLFIHRARACKWGVTGRKVLVEPGT